MRVTLAFAGVMALVLAGVGVFLYLQLGARLDESIDSGLRSRASEVSALLAGSDRALSASDGTSLIEQEESFAQVLTPEGRVVDSTPQLGSEAVLSAAETEAAAAEPTFLEREGLPGLEGPVRLLATPVETGGGEVIAVVGASLEDREEALGGLATLLLVGGPVALLLASLAGYGVAAGAFRPVEAMRRRAAAISASEPEERLPVPPSRDELARLGETLNAMLGRLEAALERERRFVDDASHELRTPLALHKTELELALRYGDDPETLRAALASSVEEVDRLIQLAEDLLVVARTEHGRLGLTLAPLAVGDLFTTVGERFRGRAEEASRSLRVDDADGLAVEGDRLRLEQALTSMVDNALRHGSGDVRLRARRSGDAVELHVEDRGDGFPPAFLDHAFERFSRADPGRSGGGSGLGLAIVETIAHAHSGRAGATNAPGGGADVWIEVPATTS